MEAKRKEMLMEAGVNVDDVLNRFRGNESLLMRFLGTFPQDPNFENFKKAMEEGRYEDAFKTLHTLKGLCGNLSIDGLYEIVCREVDYLRNGQTQEADKIFPEVVSEYERVIKILDTVE